MNFTLHHGLNDSYRPAAAALYWQAFGGKLGLVLGPRPRAMAFLTRVMRLDHCIAALDDQGALVGIAGFKSAHGSFAGGAAGDIQAVYGRLGMAWRLPLLALLADEDARFMLDGISVDRAVRGRGIGTALVGAMCALAQAGGHSAVRLDVVDANWRARALYTRLGFQTEKINDIGLLRFAFGFTGAVTMVKDLTKP